MLFKTITLKLYKPTAKKRKLLDEAMKNYTEALQWLLSSHKEELESLAKQKKLPTKGSILALINKEDTKSLNDFNVEPFKDSMKIEFASIVSGYLAQSKNIDAGFPNVTVSSEDFSKEMQLLIDMADKKEISKREFEKQSSLLISHAERTHLLYFGRYSLTRDFCLLYDETADRFFAKLYLLNKNNRLESEKNTGCRELRYVAKGMPMVKYSKEKKRYLVFPLAFGKRQHRELKRAIINPSIIHTARVCKKKGEYYLLINIECDQPAAINVKTNMGVARSEKGLNYTVKDTESGRIKIDYENVNRIYIIASKIIKKALKYKSQVILEANGGKNDAVMKDKEPAPFSTTDYAKLSKVLSYKLPEVGLPSPIEVSANGLYNVCPECGCRTKKNRLSSHIFACIECGYAGLIENIGSSGLAVRLDKYKSDKVPIYYIEKAGEKIYYNRVLEFEWKEKAGDPDLSQLYYQLALYVNGKTDCENNNKKYCIIKKLRDSDNIRDVIRIVKKKSY